MTKIFDRLASEPVAVGAFVVALLNLLIIFGVDITPELKATILTELDAIAVLVIRQKVTPMAKVEQQPSQPPPLERLSSVSYSRLSNPSGYREIDPDMLQRWWIERGRIGAGIVGLPFKEPPAGIGTRTRDRCRKWNLDPYLISGQMDIECAGWQSRIARDKNNPGGHGALNHDPYGTATKFATPEEGIDAVIGHIAGYVHGVGPWNAYSSRWHIVQGNGWGGIVNQLWKFEQKYAHTFPESQYQATPLEQRYGAKIAIRSNHLVEFAGEEPPAMAAQIPGFIWSPADSDHYQRGRSQRIRGGAQHYTAGSNSLAWLTRTSEPEVSATFLVKRNATLANRGWQLVRIEDTAWTTAFANAYTVSIEYEHMANQDIPDGDYLVLAQTWIDIAAYVDAHDLGEIPLNRQGVKGHKEWVNNPALTCPDGIDMDRLVAEIARLQGAPPPQPEPDFELVTVPGYGTFTVKGLFRLKWNQTDRENGYGSPLSEEVMWFSPDVGREILVQWYERARFELHGGQVLLGRIGAELMGADLTPPPVTGLDPAVIGERLGVIEQSANVLLFEAGKVKDMATRPF